MSRAGVAETHRGTRGSRCPGAAPSDRRVRQLHDCFVPHRERIVLMDIKQPPNLIDIKNPWEVPAGVDPVRGAGSPSGARPPSPELHMQSSDANPAPVPAIARLLFRQGAVGLPPLALHGLRTLRGRFAHESSLRSNIEALRAQAASYREDAAESTEAPQRRVKDPDPSGSPAVR